MAEKCDVCGLALVCADPWGECRCYPDYSGGPDGDDFLDLDTDLGTVDLAAAARPAPFGWDHV